MSAQIAWYILIVLLILSWGGIIIWLIYITIKGQSPYQLTRLNKAFLLYILLIACGIVAIYDYTPADSSDLKKIDQYLEQAQQDNNQDLIVTIQQIQAQEQLRIKDRKYIEKLITKGI